MSETIQILIVEDDLIAIGLLRHMIEKHCPGVSIIGEANSADEARKILRKSEVDAIFLDISMPGEDGFELLESIDSSKYMVVFTTSYDQYILKAMQASAVDYLLKPIEAKGLKLATKKLEQLKMLKAQAVHANHSAQNFESLKTNVQGKTGIHRLCLTSMQGFTLVDVKDIMYLDADNNYTTFHLSNLKKIIVSKPIKLYEALLDPQVFFRIHKSRIINLKFLKEFSKIDGYYAVMTDQSSVSVSRRRVPEFIKAVEDYNLYPQALL